MSMSFRGAQFQETRDRKEPLKVLSYAPAEMCLVEYTDEHGRVNNTLALVVGDKVFIPPNGVAWTQQFRSFTSKVTEGILAKRAEHKAAQEKKDIPAGASVSIEPLKFTDKA